MRQRLWRPVSWAPGLLAIIICFHASAQNDSTRQRLKRNGIAFQAGPIHTRMIDDAYTGNRLLFKGTNTNFRLTYTNEGPRYHFDFSVEGSHGDVSSKHGDLPSTLDRIMINLAYFQRLHEFSVASRHGAILAGLTLNSNTFTIENQPVIDNNNILSIQGIYLGLRPEFNIARNQYLRLTYLLPVIASTGRIIGSESNFSYEERQHPIRLLMSNPETSYFAITDLVSLRLSYEVRLRPAIALTANYGFQYVSSTYKDLFQLYANELLFGFKISF